MILPAPFQKHSETSREAARSMQPHLSRLEVEVMDHFYHCPQGLTDNELIERMGTISARPRRIYLTQIGKLRDTGLTRKTASGRKAVVWTRT